MERSLRSTGTLVLKHLMRNDPPSEGSLHFRSCLAPGRDDEVGAGSFSGGRTCRRKNLIHDEPVGRGGSYPCAGGGRWVDPVRGIHLKHSMQ